MNTLLTSLMLIIMTYEMPKLPYANNALEPVISQQTIDYHYALIESNSYRTTNLFLSIKHKLII